MADEFDQFKTAAPTDEFDQFKAGINLTGPEIAARARATLPKGQEIVPESFWTKINKGLIPSSFLVRAMTGETPEQLQDLTPYSSETPGHAFVRQFIRGVYPDIADVASSYTSPVGIGLMAGGTIAKGGKALETILPKTGRTIRLGSQLAQGGAGAVFGEQGGEQVAAGLEKIKQGDIANGLKDYLQGASGMAMGSAGIVSGAKGSVVSVKEPLKPSFGSEKVQAQAAARTKAATDIMRAKPPAEGAVAFAANLDEHMPDIIHEAKTLGIDPATIDAPTAEKVTASAVRSIDGRIHEFMDPVKDVFELDTKAMGQNIKDNIPAYIRRGKPGIARAISIEADNIASGPMTVGEAKVELAELNKKNEAYEMASPSDKLRMGLERRYIVDKALADSIRQQLYPKVSEGMGAGMKELMKRQGAMIGLREHFSEMADDLAKKPDLTFAALVKRYPYLAWAIGGETAAALSGLPNSKLAGLVGIGVTTGITAAKELSAWRNSPNQVLKRAFNSVRDLDVNFPTPEPQPADVLAKSAEIAGPLRGIPSLGSDLPKTGAGLRQLQLRAQQENLGMRPGDSMGKGTGTPLFKEGTTSTLQEGQPSPNPSTFYNEGRTVLRPPVGKGVQLAKSTYDPRRVMALKREVSKPVSPDPLVSSAQMSELMRSSREQAAGLMKGIGEDLAGPVPTRHKIDIMRQNLADFDTLPLDPGTRALMEAMKVRIEEGLRYKPLQPVPGQVNY